MQLRTYISFILVILIVIALATPVLAERGTRFDHWIDYNIGGYINIAREVGDACTTGAVMKQTIKGYGDLKKTEDVKIAPHIMSVDHKSDWSTPADAIGKLTMTTTIELCARPMVAATSAYELNDDFTIEIGELLNPYHPYVVDGRIAVSSIARQAWVTRVSTNPGHSGSYHADFIAAYGPGPYHALYGELDEFDQIFFYDKEYTWWIDTSKEDDIDRGDYYVGNYFEIDQYAYTSGGELRRLISMSNPFTSAYIEEELYVVGMAGVKDEFQLNIIEAGPKAITLAFWELF